MATKRDTGPWLAPRSGGYTARAAVPSAPGKPAAVVKPLPPKGRAAPSTTTSKSAA